jgi:hypothetical protein
MAHSFAKRLHGEEELIRTMLEGALLRYGVLLSAVLVLLAIALTILYFETAY